MVVSGLDVVRVEALAEEELAGERSGRSLVDEDLIILIELPLALGRDRERVLLDCHLDRVRIDTGKVDVQIEPIALPVAVRRHVVGATAAPDLTGQTVDVCEGIESHEHFVIPPLVTHVAICALIMCE